MSKEPDQTPTKVTVKVYVNDELVGESTNEDVPAYAVNTVIGCALVQVEDPDLDAALDDDLSNDRS